MPYKHTSVLDRLRDYQQYSTHYLKIKTKKSGLVNLVFNQAQQVVWRAIQRQMAKGLPIQLAILKGRQLGVSTFCQGLIFWRTVTRRNTSSLVIAHTTEAAQGIFMMAQTMYEELPEELRPMLRRSNKKELSFENPHVKDRLQNPGLRSRIEVRTAGNEEAGRGITYHALHLSEVASWPDPEVLATSLFPTVPELPTSMIVMESTAKGGGTWWHDMYVKSKNGETGYEAIFLPWFLDPEYALSEDEVEKWMDELDDEELQLQLLHRLTIPQLAFRRKMIASYGEDYFRQEYPSNDEEAWLGIGTPVFNREAVRHLYEDALTHKPLFVGNLDKGTGELVEGDGTWLRIWQLPVPGQSYVIGVDTSAGVEGGSDCAIVVLTRGLDQQHVATWAGRMNALQLVPYIEALGWMYNEALVSVEINYAGIATQEALSRVYTNCVVPETKVLMHDLRWFGAGDLKTGDTLWGIEEYGVREHYSHRRFVPSVVESCETIRLPRLVVETDRGRVTTSSNHPFLVNREGVTSWVEAKDLDTGDRVAFLFQPWEEQNSWEAGWLCGIAEGEGSIISSAPFVSISQKRGNVYDRIVESMYTFGFTPRLSYAGGSEAIVLDGIADTLRFCGMLRPERLLKKLIQRLGERSFPRGHPSAYATVRRVDPLPVGDVIALQTSSRTFFADGFVAHNSYRWRYLDRRTLTPTEKVGWLTTQTTKPLLIAHTVHQINVGRIHTIDEELLKQAYGYAYIDNQREIAVPEPGTRDDILLAFMIASYTDFLDGLYDRPHLKGRQALAGPPPTDAFNKKNDPIYTDMAPDPFEESGKW